MKTALFTLLVLSQVAVMQASEKHILGNCTAILERIEQQKANPSRNFHFLSGASENIPIEVEDYYLQDGQLSLRGKATDSKDSLFILKGDHSSLYGWIILRDKDVAYEYTTDESGTVTVEKVPVSKVFSINDFEPTDPVTDLPVSFQEFPYVNSPALPPHIGKYPGTNLNKLQSLPGAKKVFYMDITRMMSGEKPKSQSKEDVWRTWQIISAAYACFKINITTDSSIYSAAGLPNTGIMRFLDTEGRSFSPLNAFGTSQYCTVYRAAGNGHPVGGYTTGRLGWHESGHIVGVADYGGQPGGTYFLGFPKQKWVPIMGNFWECDKWGDNSVMQWSKGEYDTATTKSDVLQIASRLFPWKEDDIPGNNPIKLSNGGKVSAETNWGQICPVGDTDSWTFEITADKGHAKLKIDRIEVAGMLDVDASILDASGKVVAHSNPEAARYSEIDTDLKKGQYTLLIKGGAEGTPQKGFSNYGSLGYYGIAGEITGTR